MAINLQKGQKIDLTKGNPGLKSILIGLGWDPVQKGSRGILGSIFGLANNEDIDCDASVFMLDQNGRLKSIEDLVYFGKLKSSCGSIIHTGDNLTGDGDGDDEQIIVDLNRVPQNIHKLLFTVNIYDCIKRSQDFGMIENAFIRVVDKYTNRELIKYNLSENYSGQTAIIVGEIYRYNGEWKFAAIGQGTTDTCLSDVANRFR